MDDREWQFRLVIKVSSGMGIVDQKLLFCHGISEKSKGTRCVSYFTEFTWGTFGN